MDEAAREVFRKLKPEIKRNLNLDEDILDDLEARNTLSGEHVAKIKSERTNSEKISLLLSILQRKGPDAFQDFIDAINPAYKFLADKLMDKYDEEVKKPDRDSGNSSEESLEPIENAKSDVSKTSKEPVSPTSLPQMDQNLTPTVHRSHRNDMMHAHHPSDIHPIRRQSNHTLDLLVHPTNHFIHASRRSSHSIDFGTHQSLNGMYTKLKMHLFHMNEREQSFSSPEPVTFDMVEDLLDKLLKLEQDCTKAIGATNKDSLLTSIINLKLLKADLQKNLNKKEEQVQKYASKILKLETKCKNNEITLNQQEKTVESLRLENQHLREENEKLKESLYQAEQNKQTDGEADLKDKSLRQLSRQNEELRKEVVKHEKELEMSQKFSVLHQQTQDQTRQSNALSDDDVVLAVYLENGKRKEVTAKKQVSEGNDAAKSQPATLQECRDMCARTTSRVNMQQMKNKILFAEAKRPESKNYKDSEHQNRNIAEGAMPQHTEADIKDKRRQPYGTRANSYENMARLTSSRLSVTHSNTLKQTSPLQVRKPMSYRSLKKPQRWGKKSLR